VSAIRWVIDALGDTYASVEIGDRVERVPRWLLPADVREGDVLAVEHARAGDRASIVVTRDEAATKAALAASERQLKNAPVDKKGGDITL